MQAVRSLSPPLMNSTTSRTRPGRGERQVRFNLAMINSR